MNKITSLVKEKSIINVIWLSADSFFRLGLGFIVSVWLARYLGPSDFGMYNYAFAMITIYSAVASLGMNGVVVRELITGDVDSGVILGTSFFLQCIGSVVASVLVVVTTMLLRPNEWNLILIIATMVPSILLRSSDILKYWFESIISAKYTVLAQNVAFFISSILKVIIIFYNGSYLLISFTISRLC